MSVSGLAPFDRRGHHRRVVLDALRRGGPASRAEIAAATGLSAQTVSLVADELCRDGLVKNIGRRATARGQPPIDLMLDVDGGYSIGLQIEPGGLTGVLADLGAHVRAEIVRPCKTATPEGTLPDIATLVDDLLVKAGVDRSRLWGAGIVLPGPFGAVEEAEPDSLSMAAWSREAFDAAFSAALKMPVLVDNDATAAAIGEHLLGVARDLRTFVYLYLSEGIGGGIFVDGRPLAGAWGNAGEIGRMVISEDRRGCPVTLEATASLSALRSASGASDHVTADELFAGDPRVVAAWFDAAARVLRIAIANLENIFDPETVVLGGQLPETALKDLASRLEPLPPTVSARAGRCRPRLMLGRVGRASPALGGATLPLFSGLTLQPRVVKVRQRPAARPRVPADTGPGKRR
ncbi:ROK family transcriptional regulator [Limobrevibacterium gyesilva]|uniref:ROK family transcriptional regulator n=1 Tax=Limobrevibacterium gyesilva TaxID=2991712 RepID=A0AA42CHL9_9PROT|nr:ROK family transcriptional regulator [Limobrevibacterium gyesilva]MCW3475010.1 ROK family transcriptional regulator [Limobrevibacterium gyesilva]